jgi:CubicO group peptidase (beta-lactamase class C family)
MAIAASPRDLVEAAPEDVGMSSVRLGYVTRLVQRYIDDDKLAGAISMVARRDRLVHFETYGVMDAEAGTPMRPDAIFRMASMTKPITSVALMTLYEEGRFQLDAPLSEFIPAFKDVKVFTGGTADAYDA